MDSSCSKHAHLRITTAEVRGLIFSVRTHSVCLFALERPPRSFSTHAIDYKLNCKLEVPITVLLLISRGVYTYLMIIIILLLCTGISISHRLRFAVVANVGQNRNYSHAIKSPAFLPVSEMSGVSVHMYMKS